tara:strand:+ start:420 stop:758 length:339 start_codon:yes stop_codon:yes gene_type:complete
MNFYSTSQMASLNTRVTKLEEKLAMLMSADSDDIPNPKAKAKEEHEEQPKKKRTSGYILYSNANRTEVKERLTQEAHDDKIKNTDVMKELARMWKELSEQEKAIWNAKAKDE